MWRKPWGFKSPLSHQITCHKTQRAMGGLPHRMRNDLVVQYHYLDDILLGVLGFGAAAWNTAPRDKFMGWTPEQGQARLHLVVDNA